MKNQVKRRIVLAVGLPGSGKSSYFARRGIHPLSSDMLRLWLLDDETNQLHQPLIFRVVHNLLRQRLLLGIPKNYVDATNLTRQARRPYFRMGEQYGYELEALFFDVPLNICLERNRHRSRMVSEDVMRRMAANLTPPTREEGFSRIVRVRAGKENPL